MKFIVEEAVFKKLSTVCFGIVVAKGVANQTSNSEVANLLSKSIALISDKFNIAKVKEAPELIPYREAFTKLGINPNKYMSSIEAMSSRIAKTKSFPTIHPLVDLGNSISLKYLVPLGAHDMAEATGDIQVRLSHPGDTFLPFGSEDIELLDPGELIYSAGDIVKTRRWIWRQSEQGKVTERTRDVFFPIDGFHNHNLLNVLAARDELAAHLSRIFTCEVKTGLVDVNNPFMEI